MPNNANPNCDLYLSGYDCVTEMDNLTCLSCRDFYEIGYAADTREQVTTPDAVWAMESDPLEPWMD